MKKVRLDESTALKNPTFKTAVDIIAFAQRPPDSVVLTDF
jgi:hypothetical protein